MTEEKETKEETEEVKESLMDYASRRLTDLQNSLSAFQNQQVVAKKELERVNRDIAACLNRIDEMMLIIQGENSKKNPPPEKP